jgi:hypothetical protein
MPDLGFNKKNFPGSGSAQEHDGTYGKNSTPVYPWILEQQGRSPAPVRCAWKNNK